MQQIQKVTDPTLTPIKGGWAAHGDGWAVHGRTPEEAVQKFQEAEQRHREIDARPLRDALDGRGDVQKGTCTS